MVDNNNKSRRGIITEGDIASLLQRYEATAVLKLLQEVACSAGPKIDWNALVKRTSTGITNAREYQMLWRHLAYRDSLLPVEDGAQLLDDDSDLEYELEAFPHVNGEALVEAAAHVKVMVASNVPSESNIPNNSTVEAPLTINIPNNLSYKCSQEPSESPWSSKGINITFPVSLQKATSTEGLTGNGLASGSMASRKKRKKWSTDEDEELIAAVKRCGEGNWAHILKGDFKGDRTASQLSQRWALIRKRCDTSNSVANQSGLQRTEAQMAANHALSLAVGNRPPSKKLAAGISPITSSGNIVEGPTVGSSSSQVQQQSQPSPVQALPRAAASASVAKSRVTLKKTAANSTSRSDLMVTANTVAAAACMPGPSATVSVPKAEPGKIAVAACMATPSPAASVPKAEPGKNAAASVPKAEPGKNAAASALKAEPGKNAAASAPKAEPGKNAAASAPKAEPGKNAAASAPKAEPGKNIAAASMAGFSGGRSLLKADPGKSLANIHIQAAGPSNTPCVANGTANCMTVSSLAKNSPAMTPCPEGPMTKTIQHASASASTMVSSQMGSAGSVPPAGFPSKPNVEQAAGINVTKLDDGLKEQTQVDGAGLSNRTASTNPETSVEKQATQAETVDVSPGSNVVVQSVVGGALEKALQKSLHEKQSKTTLSLDNGSDSQSKEVNNEDNGSTKVSNGRSRSPEIATMAEISNGS